MATRRKKPAKSKARGRSGRSRRHEKPAAKRSARSPLARELRPPREVTRDLFLVWRAPRLGRRNPQELTNPVWCWLARGIGKDDERLSAWSANAHFRGPSSLAVGPGWCAARFGQSRTELPDGRIVAIAGEHEDYYDPDFFIYNDVLVTEPSGNLRIFGYPTEVFAPTDFHTATLVGDRIVVVGSLGYAHQREPGTTPVYVLDTRDFSIERRATSGAMPGWIWKHAATRSDDGTGIVVEGGECEAICNGVHESVENFDAWSLDFERWQWHRLSERRWQEWAVARTDGRTNCLFDIESLRFWQNYDRRMFAKSVRERGGMPDFALYDARYSPPLAHQRLAGPDDWPKVVRIVVEGVTVRYTESSRDVRIVVEGELADDVVLAVVEDARSKLERLEGVSCERRRLQ